MISKDLIVVGGGSAGLASAISAFDSGIKDILILERNSELGGILNQCIHPGFGLHHFHEELTGPEYARKYIDELDARKIDYFLNTQVISISSDKIVTFINKDGVQSIKAKAIIFAAGCNERTRGQISTPGYRPKGVYTAGLAQRYLNIEGRLVGKKVYILGSGDIGLIMARRMTLEGAQVLGVSEIMPYSNGLKRNIAQCLNDFNIPLRLSNTVTKIYGKDRLEGIEISDVDANLQPIKGTEKYIECDTLLLSVGLYPFNSLLKEAGCAVNKESKGSLVDQNLETSIEGIFSTGNVLHVHDLVDFVSEESERAGVSAAKYILGKRGKTINQIEVTHTPNIAYVIPSLINARSDKEDIIFSFRVKKNIKKAQILFKSPAKTLYSCVKTNLMPAEMIKIKVKELELNGYDKLSIEVIEND